MPHIVARFQAKRVFPVPGGPYTRMLRKGALFSLRRTMPQASTCNSASTEGESTRSSKTEAGEAGFRRCIRIQGAQERLFRVNRLVFLTKEGRLNLLSNNLMPRPTPLLARKQPAQSPKVQTMSPATCLLCESRYDIPLPRVPSPRAKDSLMVCLLSYSLNTIQSFIKSQFSLCILALLCAFRIYFFSSNQLCLSISQSIVFLLMSSCFYTLASLLLLFSAAIFSCYSNLQTYLFLSKSSLQFIFLLCISIYLSQVFLFSSPMTFSFSISLSFNLTLLRAVLDSSCLMVY